MAKNVTADGSRVQPSRLLACRGLYAPQKLSFVCVCVCARARVFDVWCLTSGGARARVFDVWCVGAHVFRCAVQGRSRLELHEGPSLRCLAVAFTVELELELVELPHCYAVRDAEHSDPRL